MRRGTLFIIANLCLVAFSWGCAHTPILVFKDFENEKRVEYLQERLRINPDGKEIRMELGRIFLSEAMIKQAITEFEKVLAIDSDNIQAYLLLSLALQQGPKPDLKKSEALLQRASQLEPENADVRLSLGQIYNEQREEDRAINEFNKAIELSNDPATLVSAHLGLMAIYKKQGQSAKANEEYEAAYKIFPGVEEMIKKAEIKRISPTPEYLGEGGFHPYLEERIKKLQENKRRFREDKNEDY